MVSVVIPSYRRPQLVQRAVESVLRQTWRDIEVIVVVDGDNPETQQALALIEDPRLRVKTLAKSIGCAGARNAGVAEARGSWIAFLDDDDEWFPTKLASQMRTAEQYPCAHPIVSCRLIARSEEGDSVWPRRTPAPGEPISEYLFCQNGLRGGDGLVLPSTVLTTKELLLQIPFNADLPRHNDVDWLLRAALVEGVKIVFVPDAEPLIVWHIDSNRLRISSSSDWRYSLGWIERSRSQVTPRAYASFLLIWVSGTAARGKSWKPFWILPWKALAKGQPGLMDFLAHFVIWLVPSKLRRTISVFVDPIKTKRAQTLRF